MRRSRWSRWLLVCGLCLLLVGASVTATAAQPVADADSTEHSAADRLIVQQAGEENNSTVQHENPSKVDEDGDSAAVASWLRSELGSRLGNSTLQLSNGQYERAKAVIGDEYTDSLGKLVDVAGETNGGSGEDDGGDGGTEAVRTLNQTRNTQQQLIERVQSFQDTRNAYETAKQNGNDTRARAIARDLQMQATRIQSLSDSLLTQYRTLQNTTGISTATAISRITAITENISEARRTIVVAEFIQTRINVTRSTPNTSFTNPVTLNGDLQTPNASTTPPTGTITLHIGTQTFDPAITQNGTFTVQYRPVTAPTGRQQINVEYTPQPDSVYLGSSTTTTVNVTTVTPTIDIDVNRTQLQFGDPIDVSGRVTVNNTGVPTLPLAVQIGPTTIATVETNADGRFQYTTSLPATVPLGEYPLTTAVALEDRAITATAANRSVTVLETGTNLTITGNWRDQEVAISGQLSTNNGLPTGQPIQLVYNDTQLATIETNSSGQYRATVDAARFSTAQSLNVTAVYAPERGNLENATATVQIEPPSVNQPGSNAGGSSSSPIPGLVDDNRVWGILGVLVFAGASAGGVYWWRRRTPRGTASSQGDSTPTAAEPELDTSPESPAKMNGGVEPAIAAIDTADDPDNAVQLAYSAVRKALTETTAAAESPPVTHWEFYDAYADATIHPDAFRDLTSAYEQAKYAPDGVTQTEATDAVDTAKRLLEDLTSEST